MFNGIHSCPFSLCVIAEREIRYFVFINGNGNSRLWLRLACFIDVWKIQGKKQQPTKTQPQAPQAHALYPRRKGKTAAPPEGELLPYKWSSHGADSGRTTVTAAHRSHFRSHYAACWLWKPQRVKGIEVLVLNLWLSSCTLRWGRAWILTFIILTDRTVVAVTNVPSIQLNPITWLKHWAFKHDILINEWWERIW